MSQDPNILMETAMCLWEAIVDPPSPDAPTPWQAFREQHGTPALRYEVIQMARACTAPRHSATR